MSWFESVDGAQRWGGPRLRFPFEADSFAEDIRWGQMPGYAMVDGDQALCAFAQMYVFHGRCHLARIAVAPAWRGCGLGTRLVGELMKRGTTRFATTECSLYVLSDNLPAVACYRANGFVPAPDPGAPSQLPGCIFMVAPAPG